jgi:predicted DNA-binding protein
MPYNPKVSRQVAAYVPVRLKTRMQRIHQSKPRYTLSWQIEHALEAHIEELERLAGFRSKASGDRMP